MTESIRMTTSVALITVFCFGCFPEDRSQTGVPENEAIRLAQKHIADTDYPHAFSRFTVVHPGHTQIYSWIDKEGTRRSGNATEFYGELLKDWYVIECRGPGSPSAGWISETILVNRNSGKTRKHVK
jgi:hypothetical protein